MKVLRSTCCNQGQCTIVMDVMCFWKEFSFVIFLVADFDICAYPILLASSSKRNFLLRMIWMVFSGFVENFLTLILICSYQIMSQMQFADWIVQNRLVSLLTVNFFSWDVKFSFWKLGVVVRGFINWWKMRLFGQRCLGFHLVFEPTTQRSPGLRT